MKKVSLNILVIISIVAFIITPALATKPGETVNPNGFPSGPHYNLNIHGKKAEFTCPEQKYYLEVTECNCTLHEIGDLVEECDSQDICEPTNIPIYGNSIFVPENGVGIKIYMQSGKVGGKGKKAETLPQNELWAIDPCAVFDGSATIQLPPGEYDVYARALAKPTDNPYMTVTPELVAAEDENGNDLVYLGLLTGNGFKTTTETFTRNKGKSKAIPITGLFNWTGTVCYIEMPEGYTGTITTHCCHDYDPPDGIYDYCCFDENNDLTYQVDECSGDLTGFVEGECAEIETYCYEYTDEWIFNIADFVNYLWNANNNGLKLLQVRFYPR
jgi:hypothetical protein